MYIDDEELRGLYKTSSAEHVQAIEAALMQLEKQPQKYCCSQRSIAIGTYAQG
ncbi:MAG: hypothetical protein HC778_07140 [Chamaesiphon sp. CSU_1_12]|nr:hypothetical protein [Chamaesiphon sp. CSU_1_12]